MGWVVSFFLSVTSRSNVIEMVDDQAIAFTEKYEREVAYQNARLLQRKARFERDLRAACFFTLVALRVADITGRHVGPIERGGNTARYGLPRRRINGRRTELF
jgi:hypothetical protein